MPDIYVPTSEDFAKMWGGDDPDYLPINVGEVLTIINTFQLAELVPDDIPTCTVHGTKARGLPIYTNGHLGADLLYLAPGDAFPLHVHPGMHFLLSIRGQGNVTFAGKTSNVRPGDIYFIEASVPHAVGADDDGEGHWLLSFGAPHVRVDSPYRMFPVDDHHKLVHAEFPPDHPARR